MRIENLSSLTMGGVSQLDGSTSSLDGLGAVLSSQLPVLVPSPAPGAEFRGEFASHFQRAVSEIEGKMRVAELERQRVLSGEANNLHQATLAASEAGVAFSLMVEVRNKLVESYQELMRMQV